MGLHSGSACCDSTSLLMLCAALGRGQFAGSVLTPGQGVQSDSGSGRCVFALQMVRPAALRLPPSAGVGMGLITCTALVTVCGRSGRVGLCFIHDEG